MLKTNRMIVFDMDGTIADLYGVDGWLESLREFDESPYINAKPMYNMEELNSCLQELKNLGWAIVVTTWLSKESNKDYDTRVRKAKREWLDRHEFPYDELHMVKYGTTKANVGYRYKCFSILVDDNEKVRRGWSLGATIDANEDILPKLKNLIEICG